MFIGLFVAVRAYVYLYVRVCTCVCGCIGLRFLPVSVVIFGLFVFVFFYACMTTRFQKKKYACFAAVSEALEPRVVARDSNTTLDGVGEIVLLLGSQYFFFYFY